MVSFFVERRDCLRCLTAMIHFSEIIEDLHLRNLPLDGGPFTWCGRSNNQFSSRLDHFLVLEGWENHFSRLIQCSPKAGFLPHSYFSRWRRNEKGQNTI